MDSDVDLNNLIMSSWALRWKLSSPRHDTGTLSLVSHWNSVLGEMVTNLRRYKKYNSRFCEFSSRTQYLLHGLTVCLRKNRPGLSETSALCTCSRGQNYWCSSETPKGAAF